MSERDAKAHWNERYRSRGANATRPSPFLEAVEDQLPPPGRALDVAGGSGRHALWLAARGWDVTVADVAGEGLALAAAAADAAGLPLRTVEHDVEAGGLPDGRFELVVCMHFLHRPLFAAWADALEPGGLLVFEQPTRRNLERHEKPPARFLLGDGELPGLVQGLHVLRYEEGWNESDRHEARLLARRAVPFLRDEPADLDAAFERLHTFLGAVEDGDFEGLPALAAGLGEVFRVEGLVDPAIEAHELALELSEQAGDERRVAASRIRLATAYFYRGDHDRAEPMLREVVEDRTRTGDARLLGFALQHLGKCVAEMGRYGEAAALFARALDVREAAGKKGLVASSRAALALALERQAGSS